MYIPDNTQVSRDSKVKGQEFGATWIGQIAVVARVVLGFDAIIQNIPFFAKVSSENTPAQIQAQLASLEYVIQCGTMTLQDGIDFSILTIETTTTIQRFSDETRLDPCDMPGAVGSIDVSVITRDKGFVCVSKKKLETDGNIVDLDSIENVT